MGIAFWYNRNSISDFLSVFCPTLVDMISATNRIRLKITIFIFNHSDFDERAFMYYRLNDTVILRGWKGNPYGLTDLQTGVTSFFKKKEEFRFLLDMDGTVDIDEQSLCGERRILLEQLIKRRIIHKCQSKEKLLPIQQYKTYPCHYLKGVMISLTGKCNCDCMHCYMDAPEGKMGEMTTEQLKNLIDQLEECGIFNAELTGGEPLFRSDFEDIIHCLSQKHIRVNALYTNGVLLNERVLDCLSENGFRPLIIISFDGVGWHDRMRGVDGAENAALKAFELCREKGFITNAQLTIHRGNVNVIRETVNALAKAGVEAVKVNCVSDMGEWSREERGKELSLTFDETMQAYLDYIPVYYEDGAPVSLQLEGAFSNVRGTRQYSIPMKPSLKKQVSSHVLMNSLMCSSMRKLGCIDPQGRIVPCMTLAYGAIAKKYPNLFEMKLSDVLSSSSYFDDINKRVSDFVSHNPICADCEYLNDCFSGCRAEAIGGEKTDFFAIDERTCAFLKKEYYKRFCAVAESCN